MNLLRRIFQSTALLGLAALGASAAGQTQNFAQKTKTINAAVLLLDADHSSSTTYGQTAAPYAFYNLDAASGTKPDGWVFANPYAPGVVTNDIVARYNELYAPAAPNPALPSLGTAITKRQGAYWTVRLSQLSESQIANYNVLLIAPRYFMSLNTKERELLRRFVDGGGVLWVDFGAISGQTNGVDNSHGLPYAVSANRSGTAAVYSLGANPLLSAVRQVTDADLYQLNSLDANPPSQTPSGTIRACLAQIQSQGDNDSGLVAEFRRYRPIVSNGTNPVISQARVGDGAIVVTARGVAEILNRGRATTSIDYGANPATSNLGFRAADPTLDAQERAAARLAVNITTLGGEGLQPSGSPRKTSGASADTPAPVLSRFNTEQPAGSTDSGYGPGFAINYGATPNAPPVTYKGFLVASVGRKIVVMDAIPGRDLDGDGDPDDGISDANGNTVDNYRDVSVGKPLDVIWVSDDLGATLSAPVCAEVPEAGVTNNGQSLVDQILVADANGRLHVFLLNLADQTSRYRLVGGVHSETYHLDPPMNTGSRDNTSPVAPLTSASGTPIAPVVYDGLAYIADSTATSGNLLGRVWAVDLYTGTRMNSGNDWYLGSSLGLPSFTAEPTVGYIPIADSSGGVDRVMYTPGVVTSNTQPAFASIWLGAKGEVPDSWSYDAGTSMLKVTTRAAAAGGIPIYCPTTDPTGNPSLMQMLPHLTIIDANGNPLVTSQWVTGRPQNSGGGVLMYQSNASKTATDWDPARIGVRIDYTIDWGFSPDTPAQQIVRGTLRLPVMKSGLTPDRNKRILGPIALTAHGTLHMVEASWPVGTNPAGSGSDSYFAIREDAGLRGQFRVVSRYTLYSQYNQTFGASPAGTFVPAVFNDADVVQQFLPGYTLNQNQSTTIPQYPSNTFEQFHFAGGVALRNGVAFTAINAKRGTGTIRAVIPVAMVAAFKAEPETAELRIGQNVPTNPWISQTDWARSDPNAIVRSPQTSTLSGAAVVVDTDYQTIRIENLATVVNGEITDCLSESQPIGVGSSSQTQTFRQPDAVGDRWSPLLWFGLWNGASATGTPFVSGNEVYLAAQSVLPSLLKNEPLANSGVIWSVDADSPTSGQYVRTLSNTNRSWITQQTQLIHPESSSDPQAVTASPYFRMPQNVGIASFDDYKVRLNQTQVGTSALVAGIGGGDGIVTAFTEKGLYGLSRADFVICDEGRLLQVDSSGNPVANTFGARFSGVGNGGSVANQRGLPRPVKAYPVGTSDTLVVDAGGNRVMRIGGDGSVLRSVERIQLDSTYKPAAYRVNEPLTLNDPRDATTFEGYVYKQGTTEIVTAQRSVEYWIRYLVADSGNRRIVELADRFEVDPQSGRVLAPITTDLNGNLLQVIDPETGMVAKDASNNPIPTPQVGVLVWQSPSLEGTANVGDFYNSISRVFLGSTTNGRYVYVTGVSRTRPTRLSSGLDSPTSAGSLPAGGGGAIVVFDPTGGTRVLDRFAMQDVRSATFFTPNLSSVVGTFTTNTAANTPGQTNRPFRGVQAVTAESVFVNGNASVRAMVTDLDAVYEFDLDARVLGDATKDPAVSYSGSPLTPRWMIDEAAFTALRSTPITNSSNYNVSDNALYFRPSYARRLDSGEVILVNAYQGLMRDLSTAYTGEVTLLDGNGYVLAPDPTKPEERNLGFTFNNVRLGLRTLTGIRGFVSPVFADRR